MDLKAMTPQPLRTLFSLSSLCLQGLVQLPLWLEAVVQQRWRLWIYINDKDVNQREKGGILLREHCFEEGNSLSSAPNSVSSKSNSVTALWHTNNRLQGTH